MKYRWTDDELLQHFTLRPDELALLSRTTTSHNRLGFAVLLKLFEYEGCFPQSPSSVPRDLLLHLAKQLDVQPEVFDKCNR